MPEGRRTYRYTRQLLLNALYDTLEQLGWALKSAHSDLGILTVSDSKTGTQMVIRVAPGEAAGVFSISLEGIKASTGMESSGLREQLFFETLKKTLDMAVGG
jgi:hypothetical protein